MSTVSDAIELAYQRQVVKWRAGGKKPSVASIASEAGVSRQSIYKSHRSVVEKLQRELRREPALPAQSQLAKIALLRKAIAAERNKVEALGRLCAELAAELVDARQERQAEIDMLRAQLNLARAGRRKVGTSSNA